MEEEEPGLEFYFFTDVDGSIVGQTIPDDGTRLNIPAGTPVAERDAMVEAYKAERLAAAGG
jgi:hypothetical protein